MHACMHQDAAVCAFRSKPRLIGVLAVQETVQLQVNSMHRSKLKVYTESSAAYCCALDFSLVPAVLAVRLLLLLFT